MRLSGDPPKCAHCGIGDFRVLQVDHINAGGQEDRRRLGGYDSMLKHIMELPIEEAKKEYQVLCANCNIIKRFEKRESGISAWDSEFTPQERAR